MYGACEKNEWIFISINILKSLKSKNTKPEDALLLPSCLKVQKYVLPKKMWLLWQVENTFPSHSVFVCFQQWLSSSRGQKSSMKSTQLTLHCIHMQPFPDKNDEFNLDVIICQAMIIFSSRYREWKGWWWVKDTIQRWVLNISSSFSLQGQQVCCSAAGFFKACAHRTSAGTISLKAGASNTKSWHHPSFCKSRLCSEFVHIVYHIIILALHVISRLHYMYMSWLSRHVKWSEKGGCQAKDHYSRDHFNICMMSGHFPSGLMAFVHIYTPLYGLLEANSRLRLHPLEKRHINPHLSQQTSLDPDTQTHKHKCCILV